jgi:hypothetical protein
LTQNLLQLLSENGVEFVVIGGVAAVAHGSARVTYDLDICAPLDHENAIRIVRAVSDLNPRFRMRPDLPVVTPDNPNLRGLKNLYLRTALGPLDVLGEVSGVGPYSAVAAESTEMEFEGVKCRVLDLDALIRAKTAAGREKDRMAIPELEMIRRLKAQPRAEQPPSTTE